MNSWYLHQWFTTNYWKLLQIDSKIKSYWDNKPSIGLISLIWSKRSKNNRTSVLKDKFPSSKWDFFSLFLLFKMSKLHFPRGAIFFELWMYMHLIYTKGSQQKYGKILNAFFLHEETQTYKMCLLSKMQNEMEKMEIESQK